MADAAEPAEQPEQNQVPSQRTGLFGRRDARRYQFSNHQESTAAPGEPE